MSPSVKIASNASNMTVTKKPCLNDPAFSYSGKESSPLGLGYCASSEQVGTMMKGKDTTMWMVGIKNGVKVWNRVPSEIGPLKKDEPVIQEENRESKEKHVEDREEAPEDDKTTSSEDEVEKAKPAEAPKKAKAPRKKKADTESSGTSESEKKEKKPRKPTAFNIYMRFRMKQLTEEGAVTNHKDKFKQAASEWKEMSQTEKDEIMILANKDD